MVARLLLRVAAAISVSLALSFPPKSGNVGRARLLLRCLRVAGCLDLLVGLCSKSKSNLVPQLCFFCRTILFDPLYHLRKMRRLIRCHFQHLYYFQRHWHVLHLCWYLLASSVSTNLLRHQILRCLHHLHLHHRHQCCPSIKALIKLLTGYLFHCISAVSYRHHRGNNLGV